MHGLRMERAVLLAMAVLLSVIMGASGNATAAVAGIMVTVSEAALRYAKEVVVEELMAEVNPVLMLPDVKTRITSPVGRVDAELAHIEISALNVSHSGLDLGLAGVVAVVAGDVQARVRFHWGYQYSASHLPFPVNDSGWADVQINGLQTGMTLTLIAQNGTLRLTVVECGTYIDDLEIELQGGALPWLYRFFVHAFEEEIRIALEVAVSKQIVASLEQLDNHLQTLPRFLPIDNVSAIDVAIVQDPWVSPSFVSVGVRGEFSSRLGKPLSNFTIPESGLQPGLFCSNSTKMVSIALCDYVINSAAAVYYEAGFLEWLVDKLPQESWLNTRFWRWLIPRLFIKYPNMDMALDFGCSAAPSMHLHTDGISATADADVILLVKSRGQSLPVACISLALSMDGVVNVEGNNITSEAMLKELKLKLKWSNVGKFQVNVLQPTLQTIISRAILPILNKKLKKGFSLSVLPFVNLENADIRYEEGFIFICSDMYYKGVIKSL